MIFNVTQKRDKFLEDAYKKSMKELDDFYKLNWKQNMPIIKIIPDRKTINLLLREKSENWFVAWADYHNTICLLDRKNYEKESCHKYSKEEYIALLKHELAHLFINAFCRTNSEIRPLWINEGLAIYLSGQNKLKKEIKKFSTFLEFYSTSGRGIYHESGFAVEILIKKFGKAKMFKLLKSLQKIKSEKDFSKLFKLVYGFNLSYQEFNKLLNNKLKK
jgi:hypothetical protein